ncbi:MAG: glycosyltransferase, partial [Actinobacteria bacterium]
VGGVPSVIEDRANGLLVPPREPEALAAGLTELIDDTDLRERLGKQAQEDAVARHGLGPMVKEVERVYEDVLAESS